MSQEKQKFEDTPYGRYRMVLQELEIFLHPRIIEMLNKVLMEYVASEEKKKIEEIVDPRLLALQQELNRISFWRDIESGAFPSRKLWRFRSLIDKIFELYGKPTS